MILKPVDAAFILYTAGFRVGGGIVIALATFRGESGLDTDAKNTTGNTPPSTDRGWCQLNSYWHSEISDACAYDPACAAKEAYRISSNGSDFSSWAIYTSGAYKNYMEMAWAAVDGMTRIQAQQAQTAAVQTQLQASSATIVTLQAQITALTADDTSVHAQLLAAQDALAAAQQAQTAAEAALTKMWAGLDSYVNGIKQTVMGTPT